MALTHLLVAVLAIAGYEAFRTTYAESNATGAEQFARAAIVIALFVAAIPLGAVLGAFTVSALAADLGTGLLVLTGSAAVLSVIGLGLYIVAEGEIPEILILSDRTM